MAKVFNKIYNEETIKKVVARIYHVRPYNVYHTIEYSYDGTVKVIFMISNSAYNQPVVFQNEERKLVLITPEEYDTHYETFEDDKREEDFRKDLKYLVNEIKEAKKKQTESQKK